MAETIRPQGPKKKKAQKPAASPLTLPAAPLNEETQRKLQRSVSEIRKSRIPRPSWSSAPFTRPP